jgi:hypothetical protein
MAKKVKIPRKGLERIRGCGRKDDRAVREKMVKKAMRRKK